MTILLSCGKQDFPDYDGEKEVFEHQEMEATYTARFRPLNASGRRLNISALIWVKGRQIYVKTVLRNGEPFVRHQQFIHTGSQCPDSHSKVDAYEVRKRSGEILIPLDKNIKLQEKGMEWFPVTDRNGQFYYSRAAPLPDMMIDLYKRDKNTRDSISKLPSGEKLNLEERTIVIYGTATDPLKPVACAEIDFDSYF